MTLTGLVLITLLTVVYLVFGQVLVGRREEHRAFCYFQMIWGLCRGKVVWLYGSLVDLLWMALM